MAHWRLFYHFVWATKRREPLLTPDLRAPVFRYLAAKGRELGAAVLALNGLDDHVHVVAAIPPRIAPAEFVKRLKGASSRFISKDFGVAFAWQEGYGVYSLSEQDVAAAVEYVRRQKVHHLRETFVEAWEWIDGPGEAPWPLDHAKGGY